MSMSIDLGSLVHRSTKVTPETKLKLMMELTRKISSSLDLDSVLDLIIDTVRSFIHYDSAGIYIIDTQAKQKHIIAQTIRGHDDNKRNCSYLKVGDGIVGWVVKTGNGVVVPDVSVDTRYISGRTSTRSEMAAPIRANGKVIGAFNLECDHLDAYTKFDLELLMFFANQAAISIEKAMLHRALIEKKRLEAELAVAHRVQQSLLPKIDPVFGNFEIAGVNYPTEEVGGDYFDFIKVGEDRLGLVIADVSGKGVPASLIMASFRASLRALLCEDCSLSRTFRQLNVMLKESNFTDQFVTACYIDLNRENNCFTYLNAGHNRPILLRADGSHELISHANTVLGLLPNQRYEEFSHCVNAGDLLLLYTDGITEAARNYEEFGLERLIESAQQHRHLSAAEIVRAIFQDVRAFADNRVPDDDCTLIVAKVR